MTNSVAGRTPEVKGPASAKKERSEERPKPKEEVEALEDLAEDKGSCEKGQLVEAQQALVETHHMATPPEEVQPLFTREQIHGLHSMYEQAPLLYPDFQTPQSALRRPGFLAEEEGQM